MLALHSDVSFKEAICSSWRDGTKLLVVHYLWNIVTDCTAGQFECDNGQCATVLSMCDGVSYCVDGSDQANCCECFQNDGWTS